VAKDDLPPLGAPGQRLGRYELLQRIAVGGMAEVYRAQAAGPADFRKVVAIKRLLPQHALDPQLLRMFLDESRLMARFAHPNLPQVIDVSDGGGVDVPFFAMEHVAGVDLREVIRAANGPLPLEHVLAIASAVAAGLHHAHELRADDGRPLEIVHRDVSPSNVLVSFDGGVKIADFGVAKWSQQKSFTYQGQLKGKFAHMSPEQCRGEPLDRRSDVFALGTLMYEMATGEAPFRADSEFELLSRIATEDAAWPGEDRAGAVAPELKAIIMRALKRERGERYATTREIQLSLEAFGRERRLIVSAVELAAYVESLFAERVAEWRSSPSGVGEQAADDFARIGVERTATDVFALEKTLVSRGDGTVKAADAPSATAAPAATVRPPGTASANPSPSARRRVPPSVWVAGGLAASLLALGIYELTRPARVASGPSAVEVPASARANPPAPSPLPSSPTPAPTPTPTPSPAAAVQAATAGVTPPAPAAKTEQTNPRAPRAGRTRRGEKESARLALLPSSPSSGTAGAAAPPMKTAAQNGGTTAEVVKPVPAEVASPQPAPAKTTPFSTPRPAATKIWDPDSPVPP
jgi:serine/threonine protein kinase